MTGDLEGAAATLVGEALYETDSWPVWAVEWTMQGARRRLDCSERWSTRRLKT